MNKECKLLRCDSQIIEELIFHVGIRSKANMRKSLTKFFLVQSFDHIHNSLESLAHNRNLLSLFHVPLLYLFIFNFNFAIL